MLTDLESDLVERKESLQGDAPTKIRQAVCAFANDLPDHQRPGVVFVGADDDGNPTGIPVTDRLLLQLADVKTDGKCWGWCSATAPVYQAHDGICVIMGSPSRVFGSSRTGFTAQ